MPDQNNELWPAELSREELEQIAGGATSFGRIVNNTVYGAESGGDASQQEDGLAGVTIYLDVNSNG